jgi:hypothetical protein
MHDPHFMECEAARQLSQRAEHLAGFLTEEEAERHKLYFSRCGIEKPHDDIGTAASIKWQPFFTWIKSIKINPKKIDAPVEPAVIHIYGYKEKTHTEFLYFTGHEGLEWPSRISNAKLMLSVGKDAVWINALNNHSHTHRVGSAFVQIAIEYSLKNGYEGRVRLNSTQESGLFYFKLGFVPMHEETFDKLQKGENVNGGEMYLPKKYIEIWGNKIASNRLLPPTLVLPTERNLPKKSEINFFPKGTSASPDSQSGPPSDETTKKIKQILAELTGNITNKKNNRSAWFSNGIDNKVKKLQAINDWLSLNSVGQNKAKILALIGAVCEIKRNRIGLFKPHSLNEFEKLVKDQQLGYLGRLNFADAVLSLENQENVTKLMESIKV